MRHRELATSATKVALALSLLVPVLACSKDAKPDVTAVLVAVDSDLTPGSEMDRITIRAVTPRGERVVTHALVAAGDAAVEPLPALATFSPGSEPSAAGAEAFEVEATAWLAGAAVVKELARVSFVAGQLRRLDLHLGRACAARSCPSGQTCSRAGCRPVDRSSAELQPVDPQRIRPGRSLDARPGDSAADLPRDTADAAPVSDASSETPQDAPAGMDALRDAGVDLPADVPPTRDTGDDSGCSGPRPGNHGQPCGSCGGTFQCDGSCSVPTPANFGQPCNRCGGRYNCQGACPIPTAKFEMPTLVQGLEPDLDMGSNDSITLTDNELEAYFTSNRDGTSYDIYYTNREAANFGFSTPMPVMGVNTPGSERGVQLSSDRRRLYFVSDRGGKPDVYVASGGAAVFGAPLLVPGFNDVRNGFDLFVSADELRILFTSDRLTGFGSNDIYEATRTSPSGTFSGGGQLPGVSADTTDVKPVLSADGLRVYFATSRMGNNGPPVDIWTASRSTPTGTFGPATNVGELSTARIEFPLWLSSDQCVMYLGSDRATPVRNARMEIYRAARLPAAP